MAGRKNEQRLTIARAADILTSGSTHRYSRHNLFRDFVSIAVICFRNSSEPKDELWDAREEEYFKLIGRYERDTIDQIQKCLSALLTLAQDGYTDLLGELYMTLEIGSKGMGQFFTPYHISQLMTMLTLDRPSMERQIAETGFIAFNEPTCGAGGMIVAAAETMRSLGFDPSIHMRVTAQDIDKTCCEMTYLNCVFFDIPAAIIHGDVLALEERSIVRTPALLRLEGCSRSKAA